MSLKEITIDELTLNPFNKIKDEWALLSAGNKEKANTMTVSWGGLGAIWGKNVVTVYVRPTRYTYEFCESEEYFSLSFPGKDAKKDMAYLGSVSGRETDKLSNTSLNMDFCENVPFIKEAELVFICKKLYHSDLEPKNFIDDEIEGFYPLKDYHRIYIGDIVKVLAR